MEKLGIIGTGYIARIIAVRARELGIESHCFSVDDHSVAAEEADFFHHVDILDHNALIHSCREIGINGVVATTELTILPAAVVANALGLVGNDVAVARDITDKTLVREKVKGVTGLHQPKYWVCKDSQTPYDIVYPVIVKPIAAGGKRGISVLFNPDSVEDAISEAVSVSKVKGALIEEYLDGGMEYSVESLSYHGKQYIIQVTEKNSSGPPHCVELGHHQPADLAPELRRKVAMVISDTLKSAGITEGPCHTEIKIINGKIFLIEINGRPGGDHIAYPLTELSTGYPYITGIITAALGRLDESKLSSFENNHCGVLFVTSQTAFLKPIFDKCESQPWFYKKNHVSDELKPITHNDGFNTNYFIYYTKQSRPVFPSYEEEGE